MTQPTRHLLDLLNSLSSLSNFAATDPLQPCLGSSSLAVAWPAHLAGPSYTGIAATMATATFEAGCEAAESP